MDREIKFRVWDNEEKVMFQPMLIDYMTNNEKSPCGVWRQIGQASDNGLWIYNFELLQFTGLKDRNSVEIYEGDIVNMPVFTRENKGQVNHPFEIFYMNGSYRIGGDNIGTWAFLHDRSNEIEVIGNIHQNPELLEKP